MQYSVVFLIASLALPAPGSGLAVQPSPPTVLSRSPCEKPVAAEENVVVGRYPLSRHSYEY